MRRKLQYAFLALFAVAAVALAACGETPSAVGTSGQPPLPSPTPVGLVTPSGSSIYLGAYVDPAIGGIATFESSIGRKLAMDMHYYGWNNLFPGLQEDADLANGRVPVASWNCGMSDAQIAAGAGDMLITTRAQAIKAFGHPIFLRYMPDPDVPAGTDRTQCYDPATDLPNNVFSPTEYVAAWQHIRSIFAAQNVTNVVWVWSISNAGQNSAAYYPGASQVDWVSIDAYDTGGTTFSNTVSPMYSIAAQYSKPILISETGASVILQPQYLSQVVPALQSQFPQVRGFMYYDANNGIYHWELNAAGVAAFTTLGQDPYVSAFPSL